MASAFALMVVSPKELNLDTLRLAARFFCKSIIMKVKEMKITVTFHKCNVHRLCS
jgi:hypothetical protein